MAYQGKKSRRPERIKRLVEATRGPIRARREGAIAFDGGHGFRSCPYTLGILRDAWVQGFEESIEKAKFRRRWEDIYGESDDNLNRGEAGT